MNMFSASSQLKGQVLVNLPSDLEPLGDIIRDRLDTSESGGLGRDTPSGHVNTSKWKPFPIRASDDGAAFPTKYLGILRKAYPQHPPAPRLIPCDTVAKSGMDFSTGVTSAHNSQISYKRLGGIVEFGRINTILVENINDPSNEPLKPKAVSFGRTFLVVERYEKLATSETEKDPFGSHPLVGRNGYNLARILYDNFEDQVDVIQAEDIIGHIARCSLHKGDPAIFTKPVFVAVQLDRVNNIHRRVLRYQLTPLAYRTIYSPTSLRTSATASKRALIRASLLGHLRSLLYTTRRRK